MMSCLDKNKETRPALLRWVLELRAGITSQGLWFGQCGLGPGLCSSGAGPLRDLKKDPPSPVEALSDLRAGGDTPLCCTVLIPSIRKLTALSSRPMSNREENEPKLRSMYMGLKRRRADPVEYGGAANKVRSTGGGHSSTRGYGRTRTHTHTQTQTTADLRVVKGKKHSVLGMYLIDDTPRRERLICTPVPGRELPYRTELTDNPTPGAPAKTRQEHQVRLRCRRAPTTARFRAKHTMYIVCTE